MSQISDVRAEKRSSRVKLGGSILAVVLLENGRQVRSKLNQLSGNGGLLQLEDPLDESIRTHFGTATIGCSWGLLVSTACRRQRGLTGGAVGVVGLTR